MLQARRLRDRAPMRWIFQLTSSFQPHNGPGGGGGSTQPLTEMGTRNLPGGKGRPARRTDKLAAICEPIV
jgi:hypothetical protein